MKPIILFFTILVVVSSCKQADSKIYPEPQVWYQIFPERFRNGLESNDPTVQAVIDKPKGWHTTRWTSDWYEMDDWEKNRTQRFYSIATKRRYGGDMVGILDKLDYLDSLGVNVIYFNPIFDAKAMHKYDASFYHHVDRYFGYSPIRDSIQIYSENPADPETWKFTTADSVFLELIKNAHKRNIKIVLDGVFNHSGPGFWAFQDILKNGEQSDFKDWYKILSWDNPDTHINEFDYEGWWGYKGLPEFAQIDGDLNTGIKLHIFQITKRWMDPNNDGDPSDGVDGWRLDVAEEIGLPFWEDWHHYIKTINPEVFTVAEIWDTHLTNYVSDKAFSGVMNYPLTRLIHSYFINQEMHNDVFIDSLQKLNALYLKEQNRNHLNILDSHDSERLLTAIVNKKNTFKKDTKLQDNQHSTYSIEAPQKEDIHHAKQVICFQFLMLGIPHIYYGDEVGMWGADDPDNRKPMIWSDLTYDPETNHPYHKPRKTDSVKVNPDLLSFYKTIINIRKTEIDYTSAEFAIDSIEDVIRVQIIDKDKRIIGLFSKDAKSMLLSSIVDVDFSKATNLFSGNKIENQISLAKNGYQLIKLVHK